MEVAAGMNVLVLNAGSSSLKFQVLAMADEAGLVSPAAHTRLLRAVVERLGTPEASPPAWSPATSATAPASPPSAAAAAWTSA